jgi:hypothetical protein
MSGEPSRQCVETFICCEAAEHFIEEIRGDDPELVGLRPSPLAHKCCRCRNSSRGADESCASKPVKLRTNTDNTDTLEDTSGSPQSRSRSGIAGSEAEGEGFEPSKSLHP